MDIFTQSEKYYNKPLIPSDFISNDHLIFLKYTTEKYFKYCIQLLETLCKNSNAENQHYLFHVSLSFLLKILYNCGNTPCLENLDLLIICIFSLSMKVASNQHTSTKISNIKKIYPEKYSNYKNEDINFGEIICIKILQYNINILTTYECLIYILKTKNKLYLLDISAMEFQKILYKPDKKFIYLSPMEIANNCINQIKGRIVLKKQIVIPKNKPIIYKDIQKTFFSSSVKNNESISTGSSSIISNKNNMNNTNNNFNNVYKLRQNFSNKNISKMKEDDYFYSKYYNFKLGKINNKSTRSIYNMNKKQSFFKPLHNLYDSNICLSTNKNKVKNLKFKNNLEQEKKLFVDDYRNSNLSNSRSNLTQRSTRNIFKKKLHLNSIEKSLNNKSINESSKKDRINSKESSRFSNKTKDLNIKNENRGYEENKKGERVKKLITRRKCNGNSLNSLNIGKINFDRISDLCQKINLDFINNICKEK